MKLLSTVDAIQCFECSTESEAEAENDCVRLRYNDNQKLPVKSCANDVKSCFTEIQGILHIVFMIRLRKCKIT